MSLIDSSFTNIEYIQESNYSILPENTDVWKGELPFRTGMKFPTNDIKERAAISKTNRLIYQNDTERIYSSILSVVPELEPMYGWQIREIVMNLPYFKTGVNYWVSLVVGEAPCVDGNDKYDLIINEILESSNYSAMIQSEVMSRFLDVLGAYRVDTDLNGKPTIVHIDVKNLLLYVNERCTTSIEVSIVFNIYRVGNQDYIEFICYHYNGDIKKYVFEYKSGLIGKYLEDKYEEGKAFQGKFEMSPIVIFRHNNINNEVWGVDQFRYWSPSILSAMRALQNIFRLGERCREMIRKVPETAIKKDGMTGANMFVNKGTISYPSTSEKSPDIEYITPDINIEAAIKSFEKAIKSVSMDTNLGPVFFDLEKLGSNLSAKSIEAALYPCKLELRRITTEMLPSIKELVIKLCAQSGIEVKQSDFNIVFYDGFPKDVKEFTSAIMSRYDTDMPTITLADAIRTLDRVPARVALQKANEILGKDIEDKDIEVDIKVDTQDIGPTAGDQVNNTTVNKIDDSLFENQIISNSFEIVGDSSE